MILDIFTALFFGSGCVLILIMIIERRRDVLHGPYLDQYSMGSNDCAELGEKKAAASDWPPVESSPIQRKLAPRELTLSSHGRLWHIGIAIDR
jgi:hypothetical protein